MQKNKKIKKQNKTKTKTNPTEIGTKNDLPR